MVSERASSRKVTAIRGLAARREESDVSTLRVMSGVVLERLLEGYGTPAKFQTIGFSGSSNLNVVTKMDKATSGARKLCIRFWWAQRR